MKREFLTLVLSISVVLSSCVGLIHPLTDNENEMVYKKELCGHWKEQGESAEYIIDTVAGTNGKTYSIKVIDTSIDDRRSDTSNLSAIVVRIKGKYFLDCMPDTESTEFSKLGPWSELMLMPVHYIVRIDQLQNDRIVFSTMDHEKVQSLLEEKKISLRYEILDKDRILFLEKSAVLPEKISEFEKFPEVYSDKSTIVRIR